MPLKFSKALHCLRNAGLRAFQDRSHEGSQISNFIFLYHPPVTLQPHRPAPWSPNGCPLPFSLIESQGRVRLTTCLSSSHTFGTRVRLLPYFRCPFHASSLLSSHLSSLPHVDTPLTCVACVFKHARALEKCAMLLSVSMILHKCYSYYGFLPFFLDTVLRSSLHMCGIITSNCRRVSHRGCPLCFPAHHSGAGGLGYL